MNRRGLFSQRFENQKGLTSVVFILVILLASLGIVTGAYYLKSLRNSKPQTQNSMGVSQTPQPTAISQTSPAPSPMAIQVNGAIDCGTEAIDESSAPKSPLVKLECFINATKNCDLAKLTINGSLDLGGVTTSTVYYETKGMQNGKCELYTKQGQITHVFPANVPPDQQKQVLDAMTKSVGMDGTCLFAKTSDLTTMFTNWEKGNFSTGTISCKLSPSGNICTAEGGDFTGGECGGAYFEYRGNVGQTNP